MPVWSEKNDKIQLEFTQEELYSLIDELVEWETIAGWLHREDCANWKRSAIARENRRESITYFNLLSSIKTRLGRREIHKRMLEVKNGQSG